jgi:tetratricopeptide (TPR) repeat protein
MKREPDRMPSVGCHWRPARAFRILLACTCLLAAPRLAAAETARDWWLLETSKERSVKLVLHPAAMPVPVMKYHLLPEFLDRLPGNAAVDYGKVTAEKYKTFGNHEWMKKNVYDRMNAPLEELRDAEFDPPEKSWNADGELAGLFQTLERAAKRESCDWQVPIRTEPFYSILLPELQQTREFGRLLIVRARIQIAHGQYDQAIKTLQSGYALARNVSQAPTLVHGLVGITIAAMMDQCVFELAQQPGAPNLYWALTSLPQPLIETRQAFEAEANAPYLMWPELREVATSTRGTEYWRKTLQKIGDQLLQMSEGEEYANRPEALAAMALKAYPMAKDSLIAQGMPAEKVEAMPVPQVVLLAMTRAYERLRDDEFKWFYVPYWQARPALERGERERVSTVAAQREILLSIGYALLPAVKSSRGALARSERSTAVLRLIEALRIYGAAHEGQLPDTLNDLTEVPVPIDPFTGKPFEYRREGDRAIIEGPPMPGLLLKLEIQMAGK